MVNVLPDVRFAMRFLRNTPGYSAVAVGTLALAIAANTTVFGWIDTILLRPIPGAAAAHELATLEPVGPDGRRLASHAQPSFRDFQREMTLASGVVAAHTVFCTVGPVERPRRALGQVVSANLFAVLGVRPHLGRLFTPEEDRDENGAFPMAVISHRLWRTYFNSDPRVPGRSVRLNGRQFTIVGVAPPDFTGTFGGVAFDVWVPLTQAIQVGALNTWAASDRNAKWLELTVRLKPGVTVEQATAEARAIAARIAAAYPDTHRGNSAAVVPVREASYGLQRNLREPLVILMGVCVLVLLIACANVANLLMARSVTRQKEFGVRLALGARRRDLIRLVMIEILVVTGGGAGFGILLSRWMADSMMYVFPSLDPSLQAAAQPMLHSEVNLYVLGFCILISGAAALLSLLLPAAAAGRMDVQHTLREAGRTGMSGRGSHRSRAALVVAEVALATIALVGAGLAVRSFQKLAAVNPGFDANNVLLAHFHLSTNGYPLKQEREFSHNLRLRLEAVPGIEKVAYASGAPLTLIGSASERVQVDGSSDDQTGVIHVSRAVVSPGYFELLRIPLIEGRDFTEQDDGKARRVIIVNETFARRYFAGQSAIGRVVRVSGVPSSIVGVVKDSKYQNPGEDALPYFYGPFRQIFFSGHPNMLFVRAANLSVARSALRRETAALDPNAALYEASPLLEAMQAGLFAERIAAGLLSALGLLSLVLAALGLYSVMAYAVNERTQEIGVRMAMGARPGQVLAMVLGQGLAMTAAGITLGIGMAWALGLALAESAPLSTAEPGVYACAAGCLVLIAAFASWVPAARATRIDPLTALRAE